MLSVHIKHLYDQLETNDIISMADDVSTIQIIYRRLNELYYN